MYYNVFYRKELKYRNYIAGLSEKELDKVISAYCDGDTNVTINGEQHNIHNPKAFLVFSVDAKWGGPDQIKDAIYKSVKFYNQPLDESLFRQLGENVSYKFLEEKYWGCNKKLNKINTLPDKWDIIHPVVNSTSKKLFEDGHFANSVVDAFKEINDIIKKEYKAISSQELDGDKLMKTVFSPNTPVFKLSDLATESGKNIQQGYMEIFAGAIKGIRNPKAHKNVVIQEVEAWEKIVLASHLMRMWDNRTI